MKTVPIAILGILGLQLATAARADVPLNPESLALHDAMFTKCNELQPQSSKQFAKLRRAMFARISDERLKSWTALPRYEGTYRSTLAALERASREQLMASCDALARTKVSDVNND
jgi:hypothetical protein